MNDFTKQITQFLSEYTAEVQEELLEAADEVAKEAVKELKRTSPKDKGKYAKSWTKRKLADGFVVCNKRYYLTHLLENGHAKRGGGRVRAIKHIAPVEDQAINGFEDKVRRALE
ncbi:MAG TPA: HK97 gp10 family phage protein [Epulopiscium sp.]|nr:HK97 gp10 family phage protein [Candidatus Epulonipiscium sp.]